MSGSGKDPVPNNQLVNSEPANWKVVYNNQRVEKCTTTIKNVPQSLIHMFPGLQKAEDDVRALTRPAASADGMDVDVSDLRDNYEIISEAATTLSWDISQTMVTQSEDVAGQFKDIAMGFQIFGNDIWTAIRNL
jgi:hypothetical protein